MRMAAIWMVLLAGCGEAATVSTGAGSSASGATGAASASSSAGASSGSTGSRAATGSSGGASATASSATGGNGASSSSGSSGSTGSGGSSGGMPDAGSVVVAVIGDYGVCGSHVDGGVGSAQSCPDEQAVADVVHSWNPDIILTTGDNSYGSGSASQVPGDQAPYAGDVDAGRFFVTVGNHDYISCNPSASFTTQLGPTAQYFGLTARYYALDLAPYARAYVLDGNPQDPDGNLAGSAQEQWLEAELAASTATWNLVFEHEAPYSSCGEYSYRADAGRYTDGTAARRGDPLCDGSVPDLGWIAQPRIDVIFNGHSHVYERLTEPNLSGTPTPFIVVGNSGAGLQGSCGKALVGQDKAVYRVFGAVRLTLSPRTLRAELVAEDGGVLDTLALTK